MTCSSSPSLLIVGNAYIRLFCFIFIHHCPAVSVCLPTYIAQLGLSISLSLGYFSTHTVPAVHLRQLGKHSSPGSNLFSGQRSGPGIVMTPRQTPLPRPTGSFLVASLDMSIAHARPQGSRYLAYQSASLSGRYLGELCENGKLESMTVEKRWIHFC